MQASEFAARFAEQLQEKFPSDEFGVDPGRKYDRVTQTSYGQTHVHAFVERETGHVFKSEGWKKPAKGVRYATVEQAVEHADPYGGYLYQDAAPGLPTLPTDSYATTLLNRRFAA